MVAPRPLRPVSMMELGRHVVRSVTALLGGGTSGVRYDYLVE